MIATREAVERGTTVTRTSDDGLNSSVADVSLSHDARNAFTRNAREDDAYVAIVDMRVSPRDAVKLHVHMMRCDVGQICRKQYGG